MDRIYPVGSTTKLDRKYHRQLGKHRLEWVKKEDTVANTEHNDNQIKQHDDVITNQAQMFYDSARRAEQRGEPVRALMLRNIAYSIQHAI